MNIGELSDNCGLGKIETFFVPERLLLSAPYPCPSMSVESEKQAFKACRLICV